MGAFNQVNASQMFNSKNDYISGTDKIWVHQKKQTSNPIHCKKVAALKG